MNNHFYFMKKAIILAKKSCGHTLSNPLVGCVIVKSNKIIAYGRHEYYGGNHAERNAILDAVNKGISLKGTDLYVNLEPCSHHGKQPPCCELIKEHNIKNVYYSLKDPNINVNGSGIKYLEKYNINTYSNILKEEAFNLNEAFLYHAINNRPFIVGKFAETIDGKIYTYTKESKWITNQKSRNYVHKLRNYHQAILVGANTLNSDDPELNVRGIKNPTNPIKIIVTTKGDINLNSKIFTSKNNKIIIATTDSLKSSIEEKLIAMNCTIIKTNKTNNKVNIEELFKKLGKLNIISVFVEGGSKLFQSIIENNLIHKMYVLKAPLILGGSNNSIINDNLYPSLKSAPQYRLNDIKKFDNDICIEYYSSVYDHFKEKFLCSQES